MRYTALLDANVLVPYTLTDVLLRLAETGFYRPLWSAEVLGETERTLAHMYPGVDSAKFRDRLAAMDRSFTDASVTGWEPLVESFDLPDPGDRHVVAAAVVGGARTTSFSTSGTSTQTRPPRCFEMQLQPGNDLRSPCPTSLASSHVRAPQNSPPAPRPCFTRLPELTKASEPQRASCPVQQKV